SNTSYTITALSGGNPNLRPEIADTLTAGMVWSPVSSWFEGLQASIVWYQIDIQDRVGSLGAQRIITDCVAGDTSLCQYITRNPTSGVIERVFNVNLNVAAATTSGVDLEVRYDTEPDFLSDLDERFTWRLFMGYLGENSVTTTTYRDDVGSSSSPEWSASTTFGYDFDRYGVRLSARYFDKTMYDVLWVEGRDVDDNWAASQTTFNLGLNYRGETASGGDWLASFNITNLLNRDPPIIPSQSQRGGQQNISNQYDAYGRRYQLSLNYNF
ncbi:MAG: TonB-dependent receptor, partial [Pseudomonadales bacterium]|nr:TonB-dependent receptor [Pseudomonadales bacterium]